ncbi:hypothetical protein WKR88_15105 [Trinickia caryophylli]|uniref:Zinc-finger n=1 Tax=Trinickia caryophylli TaxID=28094 RepID=A0A1X7D7E7_TRICW|nr:hypothetical protein [Trinickia caryophylli]PMS12670.1 hypothetical protein C0Z17_07495 [Trinickia caryophylli]TRX15077.1 hypothetical protein FNF07_28175 [Trinickia caryophylli]WQE14936.1 hypothetical protein U0034_20500 [Trinickia caryophylli]SMF09907.1 hypothetical protein SAMN06295900_102463 [Trinickia caryophylli]GLU31336.1 hypothetical protein Busp01_11780 [Trinickia caryophylli]
MSASAADDERRHLRIWEMLPWIVNDTAGAEDAREVQAHLRECVLCRAELARQRWLLSAANRREPQAPNVERGLDKLMQQIDDADHHEAESRGTGTHGRWQPAEKARARAGRSVLLAYGLAAMALIEAGALAMLGGQLHGLQPAGSYRTLSEAASPLHRATIRLVVDDAMSVRQLQTLLAAQHLRIVNGPGENGVYSLAPAGEMGDVDAQVAALRAAPGVRFAEPAAEALNAQ